MEGMLGFPLSLSFLHNLAGDNSKEATPDPIPNSVVKLFRVDGTAWVTVWESRSLPAFFILFGIFVVNIVNGIGHVHEHAPSSVFLVS